MENKPSILRIGLKYGLYTSLILLIYSFILQLAGSGQSQGLSFIPYLILVVEIFLAQKLFKDSGDGTMTYGKGVGMGVIISGIAGIFTGLLTFVFLKFSDDEVIQEVLTLTRINLEQQGLEDEGIDELMASIENFMTPEWMFFFATIAFLMIGCFLTLIITAFTRNHSAQ